MYHVCQELNMCEDTHKRRKKEGKEEEKKESKKEEKNEKEIKRVYE